LFVCLFVDFVVRCFHPFQPTDATWRHTFHLSLICLSFAQWFQ
jgi:hypothetical protein